MKNHAEQLALMPINAAKVGIGIGRSMLQQSIEIFVPRANGSRLAQRIIAEQPVHDAEIGVQAIKRARKRDDPELLFTGEAYLTNAILRAADDPDIPDEVVKEVVEMAEENVTDTEIELCPLLSDEKVEQVMHVTHTYRKVQPFFPHRGQTPED